MRRRNHRCLVAETYLRRDILIGCRVCSTGEEV
jgi:hypothetical protein